MQRRHLIYGLSSATLCGLLPSLAWAEDLELAVVVSADDKQQNISFDHLKALFLGRPINGHSGQPLVPFNLAAETEPRVAFDKRVLGMAPDKVSAYWIDRKIRGQRGAPRAIPSTDLLKAVLVKVPHSISYLPLSQANGPVRVVTVDGHRPDSPKYPLR